MFVGTTGHDDQKGDNPVLNGMYGHPNLREYLYMPASAYY